MIQNEIIAFLKTIPSLINVVVGFYPIRITQGKEYPKVSVQFIEKEPINSQSGICVREYLFLLAVSSNKYQECLMVADEMKKAFESFGTGMMGSIEIDLCRYRGMPLNDNEKDTELYHVGIEIEILTSK